MYSIWSALCGVQCSIQQHTMFFIWCVCLCVRMHMPMHVYLFSSLYVHACAHTYSGMCVCDSGLCVGCCGEYHVKVLQWQEESAFTPQRRWLLAVGLRYAFTLQSVEPQMNESAHTAFCFDFEMKGKGRAQWWSLWFLFLVVAGVEFRACLVHARQALCHWTLCPAWLIVFVSSSSLTHI